MANGLVHLAAVAKAHLDFGGVHVDVHARRVDADVERVDRLAVAVQHVFISAARGVANDLVAHVAAVDVGVLPVAARTRSVRNAGQANDLHAAGVLAASFGPLDGDAVFHKVFAQDIGQALAKRGHAHRVHGAPLRDQLAFVPNGKAHVGARQGVAAHGFDAVRQFGGIGFEKFASCRCRVKEFAHLHRGANLAGAGTDFAAARVDQPAVRLRGRGAARGDADLGDGRHGGQGLTAKTHGLHTLQIVQAADFAGGVALERGGQFRAGDAAAVVFDRDQSNPTGEQAQADLAGPSVQGVVDQLAHHRSGALDHFTRGDLADEFVGQFPDGRGRRRGAKSHGGHCRWALCAGPIMRASPKAADP